MEYLLLFFIGQIVLGLSLLPLQRREMSTRMFTIAFLLMGLLHFSTKFLVLFVLHDKLIFQQIPTSFAYGYSLVLYLASKHLYSKKGLLNIGSMIHVLLFVSMTVFFFSLILFIRSTGDYSLIARNSWIKFITVPLIFYYGIRTSYYHLTKSRETGIELPYFKSMVAANLFLWTPLLIAFPIILSNLSPAWNNGSRIIVYAGFMIAILLVIRIGFIDNSNPQPSAKQQLKSKSKQNIAQKSEDDLTDETSPASYEKSAISDDEMEQVARLMDAFIEAKGFTDPELSLESFAAKIGRNKHHLSQTLNIKLDKTYYQYINEARVALFIELLMKQPHEKVMDLAYRVGFNSKSTFTAYFKKATGLTPTEFKRTKKLG